MSSQNALQVYLEDHMAGSVAASDLARRGAAGNQGPLATFYAGLSREIEADRRTWTRSQPVPAPSPAR